MNTSSKSLLIHLFLLIGIINDIDAQTYGHRGMVVSANTIASETGAQILKQGGNAVDAAVATAFALAVSHPAAGNIGGGGFMVIRDRYGKSTTIDFRERAPLSATEDLFSKNNQAISGPSYRYKASAIGVPGTVAGLVLAHQRYGKLAWHDLVQPAIDMAEKGIPMPWGVASEAGQLLKECKPGDFLFSYFGMNGACLKPDQLWKQAALASTLKQIRDFGHDGFYRGIVADGIVEFMKKNDGLISMDDLVSYQAIERNPVVGTFMGHEIISMGPPSSGGLCLIQLLNMAESAGIDTIPWGSARQIHLLAESMRLTFAERARTLGDPDFNPGLSTEHFLSREHAETLLKHIDPQGAGLSDSTDILQHYENDHTTHVSVVDENGNAVSLTYTLEQSYGSRLGSEELGFIFNNEMGDFNPVPGHTDSQGRIGTKPNLISGGKRMLSSMTPTILVRDSAPVMVVGTQGGRTIINTVFLTILAALAYDMRIDKAIESLKIHHQWLPDEIVYEKNLLSPDTYVKLSSMGHKLRAVPNLGYIMGITYDRDRRAWVGYADSSAPDGGASAY